MNIKSLLLGSAAALLAVSGARAADAVTVAEPEPAEYVKICDVYGAGYFYIPGTETCLKIGGYLRADISGGDAGRVLDGRTTTDVMDGGTNQAWKYLTRFTLRTYTGTETELGTLKTYTETRFNYADGISGTPDTHIAWIQLGGLRVGADESVYDQFVGYAGNVIQDTLIPYGIKNTNLISYYFDAGNGFSAVVSLEEGSNTGSFAGAAYDLNGDGITDTGDLIDSYVPHVVGGLKYKGDWGAISGVAAYNSNWEEWAGKARLDLTPTKDLSLFVMLGYGSDDNVDVNFYKPWTGNFAVWGGGSYKMSDKVALNGQVSYTDYKDFAIAANVSYTVVPGFTVTPEFDYYDNFDDHFDRAIGGIVRFQRTF